MKTKQEIEKGCKNNNYCFEYNCDVDCGSIHNNKIILCDVCQALLNQMNDILGEIENYLKDMKVLEGDTELTFEEHINNIIQKLEGKKK